MKPTRRKANIALKIEEFLQAESAEPLKIPLYNREVRPFEKRYPEISITKGEHLNGMDLIICTISKKDS